MFMIAEIWWNKMMSQKTYKGDFGIEGMAIKGDCPNL